MERMSKWKKERSDKREDRENVLWGLLVTTTVLRLFALALTCLLLLYYEN